ncbi:RNase adapter RapZ [Salipiger sp. P9]|uniref:RNase adapter RapZ n=1 Tax=Salipiger pentaromativorans TaxID=2943193 RepID=UPI0021574884|nr:RNase adapter RapZ [Salipiger pentaromativorans]MCR8547976.1 RNase adapter RapZ [Salipiger pentaromativorans]
MQDQPTGSQRVVLVTGPSGAGRSTAINVLEDFGYEAIDNIPLSLIPRLLLEGGTLSRPVALGIDIRNRDFSVQRLLDLHRRLGAEPAIEAQLFYLDCHPAVLARRYSETRRRHPMAPDESYTQGIARELELLQDVRVAADILVDTSELSPHDLRAQMEGWFTDETGQRLAISLHSFSYKRGLPQGLDWVFDCRFLDNPHWEPGLRTLTGLDTEVTAYIARDSRFAPFVAKMTDLALFVLPACKEEGKAHLSFGFGCTGGQHRSVAVTETVASALAERGWQVSTRHRELERRGLAARSGQSEASGGRQG